MGAAEPVTVEAASKKNGFSIKDVPAYSGKPYVVVNQNTPFFSKKDHTKKPFETYSRLDSYGRCQTAFANICKEIMPTEERGAIGSVKPSGWHTVKYNNVEGKYLYNRCHLIGYQLSAENANERNLITGTRYLNMDGMLPFENMVADYVKETSHHVLYRVTPVFKGKNLLASGVLIEAYSVEDEGRGISFCVYCYNVQPGIKIDYATGDSKSSSGTSVSTTVNKHYSSKKPQQIKDSSSPAAMVYILSTKTKKFHKPGCRYVKAIKAANYKKCRSTAKELEAQGYDACKVCKP